MAKPRRHPAQHRALRRQRCRQVVRQETGEAAAAHQQGHALDAVGAGGLRRQQPAHGRGQVDRVRVDDQRGAGQVLGADITVGLAMPRVAGGDVEAVRLGVQAVLLQPRGAGVRGQDAGLQLACQDAALDLDRPQARQLQLQPGQRIHAALQRVGQPQVGRGQQRVHDAQAQLRRAGPAQRRHVTPVTGQRGQQPLRHRQQLHARRREREAAAPAGGQARAQPRLQLLELPAHGGQVGLQLGRGGREPARRHHHAEHPQLPQLRVAHLGQPARGVAGKPGGGVQ
jgi:hypothetical protein